MRNGWREARRQALRRMVASLWPAGQAAVAAALAWLIAHRLLGHPQPFFAPIAAAISLSTSPVGRSRRVVQLVGGVLLGIGVAEALVAALGANATTVGVIVFATLALALLLGAGVFGEGMMFVNQAAASAILVVTLQRHGTGSERVVDALVGGAVALVFGLLLFPSHPVKLLTDAERGVLRSLARSLARAAALLDAPTEIEPDWEQSVGYDIHQQLSRLAQARMTARVNVRIAPRRWHLRPVVDAEDRRVARLDLLGNAVLSLVRACTARFGDQPSAPGPLKELIVELAVVIQRLAGAAEAWPPELVAEATATARRTIEATAAHRANRAPVVASILYAAATDLQNLVAPGG